MILVFFIYMYTFPEFIRCQNLHVNAVKINNQLQKFTLDEDEIMIAL